MTNTIDIEYLEPVQTTEQAEQLRGARNACRLYMTRNQDLILPKQQQEWFSKLDTKVYMPFLVMNQRGEVLGYCTIALVDNVPWLTAGLYEVHRGKGLGRRVFQTMMDWCTTRGYKTIRLDVLKTNANAYHLYQKLGFKEVGETDRVYLMEYNHNQ